MLSDIKIVKLVKITRASDDILSAGLISSTVCLFSHHYKVRRKHHMSSVDHLGGSGCGKFCIR